MKPLPPFIASLAIALIIIPVGSVAQNQRPVEPAPATLPGAKTEVYKTVIDVSLPLHILNQEGTLTEARGQPTIVELYNLDRDVAETTNVAKDNPEIVQHLTRNLDKVISRGTSRKGRPQSNDTLVDFKRTQTERWGPAL